MIRYENLTDPVGCLELRWPELTDLKKQRFLSHDPGARPAPSPVGLTCPDQLHAVVQELVPLAHRAHVEAEVLQPDVLDGERDAAWPVGHVIAVAAPLEALVFDVVTQEPVVGVPPLDGQLRQRRPVLIGVEARQRDPAAWLAEDSDHSRCKQKRRPADQTDTDDHEATGLPRQPAPPPGRWDVLPSERKRDTARAKKRAAVCATAGLHLRRASISLLPREPGGHKQRRPPPTTFDFRGGSVYKPKLEFHFERT